MSEGSVDQVLAGEAQWCVMHGDSFFRLLELPPNSVDAMVADPPAGIGFMGKDWDKDKGGMREWIGWLSCIMERSLRVLKPGAHALVWALPRTSHWTGMALEYAGFEVRGQIQHWFGSGFPKSLNVSKAILIEVESRYGCGSSCTCELDTGDRFVTRQDARRNARQALGVHIEPGPRPQAAAGNTDISIVHGESVRSVRELRRRDKKKAAGHLAIDEAVLRPDVCERRTEEARLGDASLRPGLETNEAENPGAGQGLSLLRRHPHASGASSCASREALPHRRHESSDESRGAVPELPPHDRSANDQGHRLDPNRCERRRVVLDSEAGWASATARICSWCGLPDSEWLADIAGLGTATKPSNEVWWLVRKPLERGLTVAENVLKWGTGALNIDATRVAHAGAADLAAHQKQVADIKARGGSMDNSWKNSSDLSGASDVSDAGRWPPDLVLTHDIGCRRAGTRSVVANPTWDTPNRATEPSAFTGAKVSTTRHANGRDGEASADKRYNDQGSTSFAPLPGARRDDTEDVDVWDCVDGCPVHELSRQSGSHQNGKLSGPIPRSNRGGFTGPTPALASGVSYGDEGTAARYFPQFEWSELDGIFRYVAKPARSERDAGLEHFRARSGAEMTDSEEGQARLNSPRSGAGRKGGARNPHPTVKGQEFLRWCCRLITPPKGTVLTPFGGCGSEGLAAISEGFRYIGIELNDSDEEPFVSIARARLHHVEGREFIPRESLRAAEPPAQVSLFSLGGDR